jgi:hypothetical protein
MHIGCPEFVLLHPAQVQQNRRDRSQPRLTSQEVGPAKRFLQDVLARNHWTARFDRDFCMALAPSFSDVGFLSVNCNVGFAVPKAFAGAQAFAVLCGPISSLTSLRARLACTTTRQEC